MRVFVTGASGFIGSAVVKELHSNSHTILGLARSPTSAKTIRDLGGEVHDGSIDDIESLKTGAAQCDGVIHLAFKGGFADFAGSCAADRAAIEAFGVSLAGTGKPLLVTSGTMMLMEGSVGTEDDGPATEGLGAIRGASETVTKAVAEKGVRAMVVRLPPTVHGERDKGFVPMFIRAAREKGVVAHLGDGSNRWTAVHRLDAARLYRLALEKGTAGAVYHAAAEEAVQVEDIVGVIGRKLNVPVESKSREEMAALFGFIGNAFSVDNPASSSKTRKELDWKPEQPGLIADVEKVYFN